MSRRSKARLVDSNFLCVIDAGNSSSFEPRRKKAICLRNHCWKVGGLTAFSRSNVPEPLVAVRTSPRSTSNLSELVI
jgi:hypothetical protein